MPREISQGQVYWLDLGESTGSGPAMRHPCVVVQNDLFNRSNISTSVVCVLTSNLRRVAAPGNVPLKKGEANLPKASVVLVSQVVTVDKSELVEYVGRIGSESMQAVCQGLRLLFERI